VIVEREWNSWGQLIRTELLTMKVCAYQPQQDQTCLLFAPSSTPFLSGSDLVVRSAFNPVLCMLDSSMEKVEKVENRSV